MASSPIYVGTIKKFSGQVSTANANRDGSGTLVTLGTAGASGSRFDQLSCKAAGTTTAGVLRIFTSVDGGVTKRLRDEISVTAITPSATVLAWSYKAREFGLVLAAGEIVYASTEKAEVFNIEFSEGGDY